MNHLLTNPLLPYVVPFLPAHEVGSLIAQMGMEESLPLVEWVRGPILQKVFDHDIWQISAKDDGVPDVSVGHFLSWIQAWRECGPGFIAERFFELEEEMMLLLLSGALTILPEGLPSVTDAVREEYWLSPDNRFYLQMKNHPSEEEANLIKEWIDSLYATDFKYAGTLLSHAAMQLREEVREMGLRWRHARLADDGFVDAVEARRQLAWKSKEQWQRLVAEAVQVEAQRRPFLTQWASGSSFEDGREEMTETIRSILRQQDSDKDEEDLDALVPDLLHQVSQWQIQTAKEKTLISLPASQEPLLLDVLVREFASDEDYVIFQKRLSTLTNVLLSGTTPQGVVTKTTFSNDVLKQSLATVRGAINIGLEVCGQEPRRYGLPANAYPQDIWVGVGPEFLFQVGWRCLLELAQAIATEATQLTQKGRLSSEQQLMAQSVRLPLPQYPLAADTWKPEQNVIPLRLIQSKRPFERSEELEHIRRLWQAQKATTEP